MFILRKQRVKHQLKQLIKKFLKKFGYSIKPVDDFPVLGLQGVLSIYFRCFSRSDFFFVQIGANDGKDNDPIFRHIIANDVSGLLVEPTPIIEQLKENYKSCQRLIFENVAISDKKETKLLYQVKPELRERYKQRCGYDPTCVASFFRPSVARIVARDFVDMTVDDCIDGIPVPCYPINDLLNKNNISNINLLVIDTEGYDWQVLRMFDFEKFRPELIIYEHSHLEKNDRKICWDYLLSCGYDQFVDGSNTIAISSDFTIKKS